MSVHMASRAPSLLWPRLGGCFLLQAPTSRRQRHRPSRITRRLSSAWCSEKMMCWNKDSKLISGGLPRIRWRPSIPASRGRGAWKAQCGRRTVQGFPHRPRLRTREAGRQPGSRPLFPGSLTKDNRLSPLAPSLRLGQKPCFRSLAEGSSPHSRTRALSGFLFVLAPNKNGGPGPWRLSRPCQHPSVRLAFSSPPPLFLGRRSS